jgi:hypothetical protein
MILHSIHFLRPRRWIGKLDLKTVVWLGKLIVMPAEKLAVSIGKLVEKLAVSVEMLAVKLAGFVAKPVGNQLEVPGLHYEDEVREQL